MFLGSHTSKELVWQMGFFLPGSSPEPRAYLASFVPLSCVPGLRFCYRKSSMASSEHPLLKWILPSLLCTLESPGRLNPKVADETLYKMSLLHTLGIRYLWQALQVTLMYSVVWRIYSSNPWTLLYFLDFESTEAWLLPLHIRPNWCQVWLVLCWKLPRWFSCSAKFRYCCIMLFKMSRVTFIQLHKCL